MKKYMTYILLVSLVISICGCYTVKIVSIPDQNITLAPETEPLPYKKTYKVWYALWGLVPITDNTINKILADTKLQKVRVTTKQNIVDILITMILGNFSITTWTVEVEGSTTK